MLTSKGYTKKFASKVNECFNFPQDDHPRGLFLLLRRHGPLHLHLPLRTHRDRLLHSIAIRVREMKKEMEQDAQSYKWYTHAPEVIGVVRLESRKRNLPAQRIARTI